MSGEELDNFLKDNLKDLNKEPSSDAWTRVQAQVNTKKTRGYWFYMKIAASMLLVISFGIIYYLYAPDSNKIETTLVQKNNIELDTPSKANTKSPINDTKRKPIANADTLIHIAEVEKVVKTDEQYKEPDQSKKETVKVLQPNLVMESGSEKVKSTKNIDNQEPNQQKYTQQATEVLPVEIQNQRLVAENSSPEATLEIQTASTVQKQEEMGSTLVFDIEDFDMKKAVTAVYETAEETKKSGFKKVVDFVKNIKEGEGGLASLREAKNNLLVIDAKNKEDDGSK